MKILTKLLPLTGLVSIAAISSCSCHSKISSDVIEVNQWYKNPKEHDFSVLHSEKTSFKKNNTYELDLTFENVPFEDDPELHSIIVTLTKDYTSSDLLTTFPVDESSMKVWIGDQNIGPVQPESFNEGGTGWLITQMGYGIVLWIQYIEESMHDKTVKVQCQMTEDLSDYYVQVTL